MDQVACLPADERAVLFTEAAARIGQASAVVLEKDFWVCWTLMRLFAIEGMPRLLFKGGTSLSKCYGLIERFSEDIDLGLKREDIGLHEENMPSAERGSSSQKKARKALREGARAYVEDQFMPLLHEGFNAALVGPYVLKHRDSPGESVVDFHYPRALEPLTYAPGSYLRPMVCLELGARSDHYPTEEVKVSPYVAEHFPGEFKKSSCIVIAQAPERTLLEKALILHTDVAKGRVGHRSSRHAYDLSMMLRARTMKKVTLELYREVALHKRVFADDKPAGSAPKEGIHLVPKDEGLRELEADYRNMNEMFFREPPAFSRIVEDLRALEQAITDLTK